MHYFALFCIINLISNQCYSQTSVDAQVLVVVTQGTYSSAIIGETGTSNAYQTSAYYAAQGYLTTNQQIELSFDNINDKTHGEVVSTTISNVYCFLKTTSVSNDSIGTIILPYVSNGILFFEDQAHIEEIHDWLEYIIDSSTIEMNDALDIIENQFSGFSSFRTKLDLQFGITQDGFTDQELDEYLVIDFVRDEILKTFINGNRMIGIKDSVFFLKGENMILGINANDLNLIAGISALPDSIDVFGPGGIIALSGNPLGFKVYSPFIEQHFYDKIEVDENTTYLTFLDAIKEGCSVYKRSLKVELWEESEVGTIMYDPIWSSEDPVRKLTIDWGDGTEPQVIEEFNNDYGLIDHVYADLGDYEVSTIYEFTDRYDDVQIAYDTLDKPLVIDIACTEAEAHEVQYSTDGNYRMVSELFVQHNIVFKQIGAKTTFYEFKGGAWEKEKADLYAKVSGVFREYYSCAYKESKTETKLRHLKKDVQADKTKLWKSYQIGNDDITSRHYCVKGGLFLEVELVLNPC